MNILSISEFTRMELRQVQGHAGLARAHSIEVIPLAHELPGVPRNDMIVLPAELREEIKQPYVLCVGTIEIRKNHHGLLSVWARLSARIPDLPLLVVAGKKGWKAEATIERLAQQPGVLFIESPPDFALRALYANCVFTVFPSFFEGWGLPVGESLWFGKACACSNRTTMPEVGGDLCEYFDPGNADDMESAIAILLDEKRRHDREMRIRASALRSWRDVGEAVARRVTSFSTGT